MDIWVLSASWRLVFTNYDLKELAETYQWLQKQCWNIVKDGWSFLQWTLPQSIYSSFLQKNICFFWIEHISSVSSMYFLIQLFTTWIKYESHLNPRNWTVALITGAEFVHINKKNSISYALLKIIEVAVQGICSFSALIL